MGNMLAWGDQPILEPLDEVDDIESIAYDRKRQMLVKRTQRKRKLTLDNTMILTSEETLLGDKRAHRTLNQIEYIRKFIKVEEKKSMASKFSPMTAWK
jgi:hypothetical protein